MRTKIPTVLAASLLSLTLTAPGVFGQGTLLESSNLDFSLSFYDSDVALDAQGNILVTAPDSYRVFKVTPDGKISVFAGTGQRREARDSGGDGGPATEAQLFNPTGITVGPQNEVYITDEYRVRKVDPDGIITTVVSNDEPQNGSAVGREIVIHAELMPTRVIEFDSRSGRMYIQEVRDRIWRVEHDRIFHHAGSGEEGCGGDGGPPTEAQFEYVVEMAVGPDGSLYLADFYNHRIRKIDPSGATITTIVGNGRSGGYRIPDGTTAVRTGIRNPIGLALDSRGLLYFVDIDQVIYRLEPNGTLTAFSHRLVGLNAPPGKMIFDADGNLVIVDGKKSRILEVSADGSRVRTIASRSNSSASPSIMNVSPAVFPDHPQDGITPRDRQPIIGGEKVGPGEWPFVVRIDTPTGFCTGSLVAPNWVLTAAHCLVDHDGSVDVPSEISVFLGHDWDKGVCEYTRDEIGRVIIHPDYYYKGAGFRNDAALIEILEPAPADPVRILTPEEGAWYAPSGSRGTAVGWGRTDEGRYPSILHHVGIPVWTPEDCLRDSLWKNSEIVHERTLCAGVEGMGTDSGDSGGPLLVALPDGGWGQVGVNSHGRGADRGYPTVYTRTSVIYDWIYEHIGGGLQFSRLGVGQELSTERGRMLFQEANRFEETNAEGTMRAGSYTFQSQGSRTGRLRLNYDDGKSCTVQLTFTSDTAGTSSYHCNDGSSGSGSFQLTTGEGIFVPVILTAAGRNNSFFSSELTLTNRSEREARLNYTYTAHVGGGSGTGSEVLAAGRQKIVPDAMDYLKRVGLPIPESGNRIGTLRVDSSGSVGVLARTTTVVPSGRAGLAYPGIAGDAGFEEAVYLCGLRQNRQDRSNVAFQNMGTEADGPITVRTTVFSGDPNDSSLRVLKDVTLGPGGFHQFSGVLGSIANGYVRVERVEGGAPFYAYGVINDQANSDGSFVFPVTASSLAGTRGQTLPVIIETAVFGSELTVTNFSDAAQTIHFRFVADKVQTADDTALVSLTLQAGEQRIIPNIVNQWRQQGVAGIGPAGPALVGAVFATVDSGDMSGIVIGARTGSPGGGGQYSLFYNAVPYGLAFSDSAWIDGLQQNAENRSNLALVNTGEEDDSESVFNLDIYDGDTGMLVNTVSGITVAAQRWRQLNSILGNYAPGTRQGYVQVRKTSGGNPFLAYGVINDGGAPRQRSDDGAYVPARE